MKENIIIIINEFYSGGIGKYIQKLLPALTLKYKVAIISRDHISKTDMQLYKISKNFVIKLPKYINFWPIKEIYFSLKTYSTLKNKKGDLILCNYSALIPPDKRNVMVIQVFHSLHSQYYKSKTPLSPNFIILKIFHLFMSILDTYRIKTASKLIAVSEKGFDEINSTNKLYIPNPIDKKIVWKRKAFSKGINIVFVARNDPFKGLDFLEKILDYLFIKNLEKYNKLKFYIIGCNNLKKNYPKTYFLGKLSFKETLDIFKKSHIFISTSYLENSPNTLFESLSTDCVPLVSDVGDCAKILQKENRFLYQAGNLKEFIFKFNSIIDNLQLSQDRIKKIIPKINKGYLIKLDNLIENG